MTHILATIAADNRRIKFAEVEKLLLDTGWTKTHTVCHDGGANGAFGTCFVKNGKYIFLNIKTVDIYLELLRD
jgi:hypothetical protein